MARSMKRFVIWAVTGCVAALALARLFADGEAGREMDLQASYRVGEVTRANRRVTDLTVAVHALQLHDSVRRALQSRPARAGVSVVLPNRSSTRARLSIDSTIRATWIQIVGDRQWGSTVFLAVEDTGRLNRLTVTAYSLPMLLPSALDGRTCVILLGTEALGPLELATNRAGRDSMLTRGLLQSAGPCAFIARYGEPGTGTRAWLSQQAWAPGWIPPFPAYLTPPATPKSLPDLRFVSYAHVPWYEEYGRPSAIDHETLACLGNRAEPCMQLLRRAGPRGTSRRHASLPSGVVAVTTAWGSSLRFGTLALLERELGSERFAQFWKSEKAPELALAGLGAGEPATLIRRGLGLGVKPYVSNSWPTPREWLIYAALILIPAGLMLSRSNRRFLPT